MTDLPAISGDLLAALETGTLTLAQQEQRQLPISRGQAISLLHKLRLLASWSAYKKKALAVLDAKEKALERECEWFMPKLLEFVRNECKKTGGGKSFVIGEEALSGKLRKSPDSIELKDEGAFFLSDPTGRFVRFKVKFPPMPKEQMEALVSHAAELGLPAPFVESEAKKADVKEHWKSTGELLPGWRVVPGVEQLIVDGDKETET